MGHQVRNEADMKELVGKEVGVSDWILIDQARINKFAEATDDFQWIHTDPERAAKEFQAGCTIAHGYLTLSLIPALIDGFVEFVGLEQAINYGINKARFRSMVPVDSKVRARAVLKQGRKRAGALQMTLEVGIEVEGQKKPAVIAETMGLYYLKEESAS